MGDTDSTEIDELGPVDYLVVEFPPGAQNFDGEMAAELARLSDAGTIRVMDLLILQKAADGSVNALEIDETDTVDEIRALETHRCRPNWPPKKGTDMPLRPARVARRGVIGAPVARTAAVVGTAAVVAHGVGRRHDRRDDRRDDRGDRRDDRRDRR